MPQSTRNQVRLQLKYNVTTDFPHLGLHSASASGDIGLVQYALSHGQPVNSVLDGVLPLHAACAGGNVLVVNLLIDCGADVNAPRLPRRYSDRNRDTTTPIVGTSGSTPLHFAAANGHLTVVRTLLSRGAAPDRADKHGITPELIARQNGWIECADLLAQASPFVKVGAPISVSTQSNPLSHQRDPSSCPVDNLEASLRKRLHFKRSVDHTLSTTGGTSDPEARPSLTSPNRTDHESDSHPGGNSASLATHTMPMLSGRRPSLPQALDDSPINPSIPTRSARPRSAGTGADSRKLHSKLSLLTLFKKSNADGSSSSVASLSESPAPSSPLRSVPILTSHAHPSSTPPVSPRSIPIPLSSSPRDTPHIIYQPRRLESSASLSSVRAYPLHPADLHSVLTAERSRNHSASGSVISPHDEDSGSADGSGSISGTPIKSGILRMHDRSRSGHGSVSQPGSLPRNIRFERSASESTPHPARAKSPSSRGQLENRMRSLGIASGGRHDDTEYARIPDTIEESPVVPHAVPPVFVNIVLDHDDDVDEEYGIPLSNSELHPTQDHSLASSQLPFSINVPPPSEDALAESRLRGDSVSSASTTATASTYPQSSSSDAAWSIATPSTPHLPGSPRIRPALGEYEADAEEAREIHQRSRRLHFPLDIDISTISSHAQAEELVQRAQQSILNMEQYLEQHVKKDSETGRTPLSAKLAAYGESLAIERRLKGKVTVQTADVGHSSGGVSLLSATKPSHIYPSPHSAHCVSSSGKTSQEHLRQTTWIASSDDSPHFGYSPPGAPIHNIPRSRTPDPDPDPDLASGSRVGVPLSRVSTAPSYDSTSARRGRERDPSRSFQKLSRMGFSTFDNWQPSPIKGRASRSPPPSLRFGLRTIMQSFQGK